MKVALMLTGLARKVREGYDSYWKYVIDNNDCDLYLHAWESIDDDKTNHENSNIVKEVYPNAKYFYVEKPFKFTKYREGIGNRKNDESRPLPEYDVFGNFRSFPMYYSWESTYKHILNSGIQYDCVIRSRYDMGESNLDLNKLDLNKINTSNFHYRSLPIHDDNILVTNMDNATKVFTNVFTDIVEYHKGIGYIDTAEENFTNYLNRNELNSICEKTDNIDFRLLREDKVWF
jgi:hypothetical protein